MNILILDDLSVLNSLSIALFSVGLVIVFILIGLDIVSKHGLKSFPFALYVLLYSIIAGTLIFLAWNTLEGLREARCSVYFLLTGNTLGCA
jgi:hypothetical protein